MSRVLFHLSFIPLIVYPFIAFIIPPHPAVSIALILESEIQNLGLRRIFVHQYYQSAYAVILPADYLRHLLI